MAIIIDTNCFGNVFVKSSAKHSDFSPVLDWLLKGSGFMVFGGTKYMAELTKASKYLTIIRHLKEFGKVLVLDTTLVDLAQLVIESVITNPDFDDPHLAAIVIASKCRLICSEDKRSIKFVTEKSLYPKGIIPPVYYTSQRNKKLLCDKYIDKQYKPILKLAKNKANDLSKVIIL